MTPQVVHSGVGEISQKRILTGANIAGGCNFVDYAEIPPGAAIGEHRHSPNEEEFYLFLSGSGLMRLDDAEFQVTAGDFVRNKPGGFHGLKNTGPETIRLFVFELATNPAL